MNRLRVRAALFSIAALALAACGDEAPAPPPKPPPAGDASISGRIAFDGAHQRPEIRIPRGKCTKHHPEPPREETIVVGENGGLRDVLVHVKAGLNGTWPPPEEPAVLDQRGCIFRPHVLAIQVGQDFKAVNSDDTLHNIHIFAKQNGRQNFNMPKPRSRLLEAPFDSPELNIPVGCDSHSWMDARIHVLDHPKFFVTGEDGAWSIEGLPAGTYTIEALHPKLGRKSAEVTLSEGESKTGLDFTFSKE